MPIQYDEQDDYDHFQTKNVTISKFNLDNITVREALKRIVNHLLRNERTCFIGELALESGYSIEKTEILVAHLSSIGLIERLNGEHALVALKKRT